MATTTRPNEFMSPPTELAPTPSTAHKQFTWRIKGIPLESTLDSVRDLILSTCGIDQPYQDGSPGIEVTIRTLAPDAQRRTQQATVSFSPMVPPQLSRDLKQQGGRQAQYKIPGASGKRSIRLSYDTHFIGQTVLYDPEAAGCTHESDVLAISGLGSHAYGSFVCKDDKNMWLAENLPEHYPGARVILWGYDTKLRDNDDFSQIEDLAHDPYIIVKQLLLSGRPLFLIGHSLGGLLIQEALSRLAEDERESEGEVPSCRIGILFFGVPSQGMDISSLRAIVQDQPNRALLETLEVSNSPVLRSLLRRFHTGLGIMSAEIFCFYETHQSPTTIQDPVTKRYAMKGPLRFLVNRASATAGLPATSPSGYAMPLRRNHSDLVKFSFHDAEFADKVDYAFGVLHKKLCAGRNTSELQNPEPFGSVNPPEVGKPNSSSPELSSLSDSQMLRRLEALGLSSSPATSPDEAADVNPSKPSSSTNNSSFGNGSSRGTRAPAARSPASTERVRVTFINQWWRTASVQWLDGQGNWVTYCDILPGANQPQDTFVGHVWRALDLETGNVIRVYTASMNDSKCYISMLGAATTTISAPPAAALSS